MINTLNKKVYLFYMVVDLLLIALSFFISYFIKFQSVIVNFSVFPQFKEYSYFYILWSFFILNSFRRKGLYSTDRSLTIPEEIFRVSIAILKDAVIMAGIVFLVKYAFFSRQIFLTSLIMLCFLLSGWRVLKRIILRRLIKGGFHNVNILLVGMNASGRIVYDEIKKNPYWGFKIIGFLDKEYVKDLNGMSYLGNLDNLQKVVKNHFVDEIIIAMPLDKKDVNEIMQQAKRLNLGIRIIPDTFEEPASIINISQLGILSLITYKEKRRHPAELFLKRSFDVVVAFFSIILLSPLFIILAILIKLDSEGPIFFVQKRVGLKGRIFNFYKFRSMVNNADKLKSMLLEKNEVGDGVIFKIKKDPRLTKLGKTLRRYSLDELPQLINVLKGEMSIVGPRPPTPDEVVKYNHFHMDRLSIRPGLTCLSQVKGRSRLTFRKWVKWDLWYINNWSFALDLKILWLTIPVIFKGEGAY